MLIPGRWSPTYDPILCDKACHSRFVHFDRHHRYISTTFGFIKNYITVKTTWSGLYGAIQTLRVGAIAAGASYGVVYGIDHSNLQ